MSVKRKDLIKYLEENGYYLLREGGNHSIYTNDTAVSEDMRYTFGGQDARTTRV